MKPWYSNSLRGFGFGLMLFGFAFFAVVYPTGAPVVPWAGLVLAFSGAWIGYSKPRQDSTNRPQNLD
jgi:hypothetical protein